jgi:hypothetical protein
LKKYKTEKVSGGVNINEIYKELVNLGLSDTKEIVLHEIRHKAGISLYKVTYKNNHYVLKYFVKVEDRREIKNYSVLNKANIPTIKVIASTNRALLLEDLNHSNHYRLGVSSDLSDVEVAKALAVWYIKLHNIRLPENYENHYQETAVITRENIEFIKNKSNTSDNKIWDLILDNFELILDKVNKLEKTLTYNDFYWTNLAVSKDKKEAIMFDYNLLGVSYRYSDFRNVCSSLQAGAREVFIKEYGAINETEAIIDAGLAILINLIFAYKRPKFPEWAKQSLGCIYSGELEKAIIKILNLA